MALQFHINGGASLQDVVCHKRSSLPSSTTSAIAPSFVGRTANAWSRSSLLSNYSTHWPEKQHRRLRAVPASNEVTVDKSGAKYDEEFPPLPASVVVAGLPPCQGSVFVEEVLAYMLTMGPVDLLEPYYHVSSSYVSFGHCGVVSVDRFAAMAGMINLMTIFDDILLDDQDAGLLEKLGIDPTIITDPERIMQYFRTVDVLMRQEERPAGLTVLEDMVWKVGRDIRALCPSIEWFNLFADSVLDFYITNCEFYRDSLVAAPSFPDLPTFTQVRLRTAGSRFVVFAVQFCQNSFLSAEIREHQVVERLDLLTMTYSCYIQDIFSYSRDVAEGSTSNLLDVIVASERGMTLQRAAWKAVNMTTALAQEFLELEASQMASWEEEPWGSEARLYMEGLKELMSGYAYWHSRSNRYRYPDSPFPEMREINISNLPDADSLRVISQ